jgi:hypothetical protein
VRHEVVPQGVDCFCVSAVRNGQLAFGKIRRREIKMQQRYGG